VTANRFADTFLEERHTYSKHRRTDVLPLRKDFAERIRLWIDGKWRLRPDRPLFKVTGAKTSEIIRRDLDVEPW
jgi:hypothetical protein